MRSSLFALLSALPLLTFGNPIPSSTSTSADADIVPDSFIIVLKDGVSSAEFNTHTEFVSQLHNQSITQQKTSLAGLKQTWSIYDNFKGYAGQFDQATVDQIATRTEVKYIEPDRVMRTQAMVTETNAPQWGLASISHRVSTTATNYVYDSTSGTGTTAYVIDTGILTTHDEFTGRATFGVNFVDSVDTDENGHGTHVSGILAGTTFGVAKGAKLVAVKVMAADGTGLLSTIVTGVQWALNNSVQNGGAKKAVANLSVSGFYNQALNDAIAAAVAGGMTVAVAAGNNENMATGYSPASAPDALTVGAITSVDARAGYSNFGTALDIWAPGDNVLSAYIGSNDATATLSGTSMASPQIAGLAAYLIAMDNLASPADVRAKIVSLAVNDVTGGLTGSPTIRAYNGNGA